MADIYPLDMTLYPYYPGDSRLSFSQVDGTDLECIAADYMERVDCKKTKYDGCFISFILSYFHVISSPTLLRLLF